MTPPSAACSAVALQRRMRAGSMGQTRTTDRRSARLQEASGFCASRSEFTMSGATGLTSVVVEARRARALDVLGPAP
ncbi:MAG: hypothetical protein MZW92_75280 [Comamonadaceae bacterium]|nr:hypothetical protein [Comamonadaceae bacterium]